MLGKLIAVGETADIYDILDGCFGSSEACGGKPGKSSVDDGEDKRATKNLLPG